ncbi:MAG: response regulator [Methanobacteriota archaeon]|nr:MAG: response regulator [Euryarchaeota archaeon]
MSEMVMVVDDEKGFLHLARKILEKEGYRVITAESGAEALEKLRRTRPDLILLDVMMPEMDGWELCRRIKGESSTADIAVAMLTVRDSEEDKVKSLGLCRADWHITKPDDFKKIGDTVRWLIERSGQKKVSVK